MAQAMESFFIYLDPGKRRVDILLEQGIDASSAIPYANSTAKMERDAIIDGITDLIETMYRGSVHDKKALRDLIARGLEKLDPDKIKPNKPALEVNKKNIDDVAARKLTRQDQLKQARETARQQPGWRSI